MRSPLQSVSLEHPGCMVVAPGAAGAHAATHAIIAYSATTLIARYSPAVEIGCPVSTASKSLPSTLSKSPTS
jgi:hypothetical protein